MNPETLLRTGRTTRSGPMSAQNYPRFVGILREHLVHIKVYTVVSRFNSEQDLTGFIIDLGPERWKLLQVLPVGGQNDSAVDGYLISVEEFQAYLENSRRVEEQGITVVPETNDLMTGSYVIVDPAGRFFDNVAGFHTYSRPILEAGVEQALKDVSVDAGKSCPGAVCMPGNRKPRKMNTSRRRNVRKNTGEVKGEAAPELLTSGQILGVMARSLGITHPHLGDKTAQRYFSGRLKDRVKESSGRARIIDAISENMAATLFANSTAGNDEEVATSPADLSVLLDWHAATWEQLRAFLRPRVMRVYSEHMDQVWQAYARLAAIDSALRAAAHLHITGAPPASLAFLDFASVVRRGEYLNRKLADAGLPLNDFVEAVGVTNNAAQAWLYDGARPTDKHLIDFARALVSGAEPDECNRLLRELRRLYWVSDMSEVLGSFMGTSAMDEIIGRLHRYSVLLYTAIDEGIDAAVRPDVLGSLAAVGAHSEFSGGLMAALVPHEGDEEWQDDLNAAASDWSRRVLAVNLNVHPAEEDALIRDTDGRVLCGWDISNPEAYVHYRRFGELQLQGRIHEAIAVAYVSEQPAQAVVQ